jgi:hypothetical protein
MEVLHPMMADEMRHHDCCDDEEEVARLFFDCIMSIPPNVF